MFTYSPGGLVDDFDEVGISWNCTCIRQVTKVEPTLTLCKHKVHGIKING